MVNQPSIDAITWSTKLQLLIRTPSLLKQTGSQLTRTAYTFERLSVSRNREQRTINSVAGARKGFTTVEGDFSFTISLPETDPNTAEIEKLYASNTMFDITLEQRSAGAQNTDEWKLNTVVARGCMFENASTSYDANDKPMREYTGKFLMSVMSPSDGTPTIDMRDGNYAVRVAW